ncbi:MAG: hypothetical protein RIQ89_2125 [Bacteroidota bacterium]
MGLLLLISTNCCIGQQMNDVYARIKRPALTIGLSTLGITTSSYAISRKEGFSEASILLLNKTDIPRLDRWSVNYYDRKAQIGSDMLGIFSTALVPSALFLAKEARTSAYTVATMYVQTMAINYTLTQFTKYAIKRARPYVYNSQVSLVERKSADGAASFFSGHTSFSAAGTFFTAKVFTDLKISPRHNNIVWVGAALLPAATGLLRIKGGKHFLSDVAVGYAIGALTGYLIPKIHLNRSRQ